VTAVAIGVVTATLALHWFGLVLALLIVAVLVARSLPRR
jgi:hypothetical protein